MKKTKRNSAIIVLLVLIIAIAVGYAAFQTTLTINGTVSSNATWDVKFTDAKLIKGDGTVISNNSLNSATKTDTAVKAIGSFALDGAFAVRGVRVMEDKNGHNFVAFPSREKQDGSYEDIAFPLSKELYGKITDAIINEYKDQVEKQSQDQQEEQAKEQTQTEGESEAKSAPKRGRSR